MNPDTVSYFLLLIGCLAVKAVDGAGIDVANMHTTLLKAFKMDEKGPPLKRYKTSSVTATECPGQNSLTHRTFSSSMSFKLLAAFLAITALQVANGTHILLAIWASRLTDCP